MWVTQQPYFKVFSHVTTTTAGLPPETPFRGRELCHICQCLTAWSVLSSRKSMGHLLDFLEGLQLLAIAI